MTTLQELSMRDIFQIRDALQILDRYGYAEVKLKTDIQRIIEDFRDGDWE